ncbi:hypothetical protein ACJX0J_006427, partial [Zea mays]
MENDGDDLDIHIAFIEISFFPILGVIEPLDIFLIFSLQALIIIAWNGGAPSDIFDAR